MFVLHIRPYTPETWGKLYIYILPTIALLELGIQYFWL